MHSSTPLCASLICCFVFLLDLLIKDLDRGLARDSVREWLPSADPEEERSFSGVGLTALLPPLLADTYALDRLFRPVPSSESLGNSLDNVRKERNISRMLMSSFAEHSRTFTLKLERRLEFCYLFMYIWFFYLWFNCLRFIYLYSKIDMNTTTFTNLKFLQNLKNKTLRKCNISYYFLNPLGK